MGISPFRKPQRGKVGYWWRRRKLRLMIERAIPEELL
jgi:hypothetical protein